MQADRDSKAFVEAEIEKQKVYVDHGVDSIRKMQVGLPSLVQNQTLTLMQETDGEGMRSRVAELSDSLNGIEANIAEVGEATLWSY